MKIKNTKTKSKNEVGYSFWGIVATIVGTVIGIGIFFKAGSVVDETGLGWLSIVVWIFGSLIIGCLLLAYIEIASSTAKTGEVGSLSTWSKKFFNPKVAKLIGMFITFIYFPTVLVLLTSISLTFIIEAIVGPSGFGQWEDFAFIFTLIPVFIGATFALNIFIKNGGERWQMVGTTIKFIPFLLIIIVGFFMAVSGSLGDLDFDSGRESKGANGFFLAMPAIIFSFDGFIYAANLQNEMKDSDKKKFPKAIVLSVIVISLVYILVAVMLVWIGDDAKGGFNIPAVLNTMFGGQKWLSVITLVIIAISGLTGMNGFTMMSLQAYKSLSEDDAIADKNNKLTKVNKNNIPKNSALSMFATAMVWYLIFIGGEIIMMIFDDGHAWTDLIDNTVVSGVIIANIVYGIIILGGLWNRRTNKVEVERMKWFVPLGVIGSFGIIFASAYNIVNLFIQSIGHGELTSILTLVIIALQAALVITVYLIGEKRLNKINMNSKPIVKKA